MQISLFCEFCRGLSHDSHICRENFHRLRTSHKRFVKVLNNFLKILCDFFFARIFRKTVAQWLCECREPVAAIFWQIYNAKISRHWYKCLASVVQRSCDSLEKTCEHLATIWRENKTKRHSYK